jgi:hypothetical protein
LTSALDYIRLWEINSNKLTTEVGGLRVRLGAFEKLAMKGCLSWNASNGARDASVDSMDG